MNDQINARECLGVDGMDVAVSSVRDVTSLGLVCSIFTATERTTGDTTLHVRSAEQQVR